MSRLDYQPRFGEGRPDTRERQYSSLTYVWIYENGVKKFSKGDDIKIKRIVSLLPSTRLSSFYCCPFSFAISFLSCTWLGVRYEWFGTNYWHRFQKSSHTYIKKWKSNIQTWDLNPSLGFSRYCFWAPRRTMRSSSNTCSSWSPKFSGRLHPSMKQQTLLNSLSTPLSLAPACN